MWGGLNRELLKNAPRIPKLWTHKKPRVSIPSVRIATLRTRFSGPISMIQCLNKSSFLMVKPPCLMVSWPFITSFDGWIVPWWLNHYLSRILMVGFPCAMFESPFVTIFDGKILNFADEIPIFDEIPPFFAACHRRAHLATRLGSGPGANWTLKGTHNAMEGCASSMVQTQVTPLKWQLWIGSFYIFGILQPNQVGGLEHDFFSHHIGNVIIPTDELIFFRGVGIPPTRIHANHVYMFLMHI